VIIVGDDSVLGACSQESFRGDAGDENGFEQNRDHSLSLLEEIGKIAGTTFSQGPPLFLPAPTARRAFQHCAAKLNQVFIVFDAFLEPTHLGSVRFQGRLLNGGNATHMLSCDPSQHTR
jgi:hypothetical protein